MPSIACLYDLGFGCWPSNYTYRLDFDSCLATLYGRYIPLFIASILSHGLISLLVLISDCACTTFSSAVSEVRRSDNLVAAG